MAIWRRMTRLIADVMLSQEFRRIDENGERVSAAVIPTGCTVGCDDDVAVPVGFLRCDGTVYSQKEYPALYNVLVNIYGGTPGVSFAVPDVPDTIVKV